ncbi:MAG: protein kinase [Zavarzinella sp.]
MPAPQNLDEFVDLVKRSGVLEEPRLNEYVKKLKAGSNAGRPVDQIAGYFVRDGLLTYFQAEQFLQGRWKRFSIGKYRVLERIGSGGMGQVFLCEHKHLRRRVAVKVLPTSKATDSSALERFYREGRAVAALDHENIVHAYDIDQDDNLHFLVMEYVDGSSLQDIVSKTGPLSIDRCCHYMYWSAVGLHYANVNGLIHRDVKPGNILVDRSGVVKILDLGLARFFRDSDDHLTRKFDETVLGTADYLAPEQALDSHTVDTRADIYSLGATLYFMLTGQPPFKEGTVAQKLLWHQSKEPVPASELRKDVPPAVEAILKKMMAKNPDDRYQTLQEVADDFLPFTQTPINAPPVEEMPSLSAAANAGAGSSTMEGVRTVTPAPRTPLTSPSGSPIYNAATSSNSINSDITEKPQQPKRQPTAEKATEVVPEPSPELWSAITDTPPSMTSETVRPKSSKRLTTASSKKHPRQQQPTGKSNKLIILLSAVGFLVILAGAAGAGYYFFFNKSGSTPDGTPTSRELIVTRQPAGERQYATLREAYGNAKEGDTITLDVDTLQESIILNGPRGITLQASPGKQVVWKKPANAGGSVQYLLGLSNPVRFELKNIHFDGEGFCESLVKISGRVDDLKIHHLELSGASFSAISFKDCIATEGNPAQVTENIIYGAKGSTSEVGIELVTTKLENPRPNQIGLTCQHLHLEHNLLVGAFSKSGVLIDGSMKDVSITHNRIVNTKVGIEFAAPRPEAIYILDLTNNSFLGNSTAGIQFAQISPPFQKPQNRLGINNNLFIKTPKPTAFIGANGGSGFIKAAGNYRQKGIPDQKGALVPTKEYAGALPPENVADTKAVLFPASDSPLSTLEGGKPVGAQQK